MHKLINCTLANICSTSNIYKYIYNNINSSNVLYHRINQLQYQLTICTTRHFNTRQGSRVKALFPKCHHECVSGAGICPAQGHTPLCNRSATGTRNMLDEWGIPGHSSSCHAHRHVQCQVAQYCIIAEARCADLDAHQVGVTAMMHERKYVQNGIIYEFSIQLFTTINYDLCTSK